LAVGANGETLVADSAATTGLRYSATPSASNPIINSSFQAAQRGTSFAIPANTSTYGLDRWTSYRTATGSTVSRQVTGDTTNLPFIQYAARVQRDSGNTSTAIMYFTQAIESVNTIPFAGKAIAFSFYARAGANYSATSNILVSQLTTGTGTDQAPYAGYTGSATPFVGNHTLTTTWQRFTATGTIGATVTEMLVQFQMTPTGTAGANDYFEVTGIQLDVGSVALPFRTYAATIQGELAACQRYYQKTYNQSITPGNANDANGPVVTQATAVIPNSNQFSAIRFVVTMRGNPTVTIYSYQGNTTKVSASGTTEQAANSGIANQIGETGCQVYNGSGGNITPSSGGFMFHYAASAEL
jgi:hypothetical protein